MLSKKCLVCNKEILKSQTCSLKTWNTQSKFCSQECKHIYQKGKNIHTEQHKEELRKHPRFFTCEICGKKIKNIRGSKLIKFCSQKCNGINKIGNGYGFQKGFTPWNKDRKETRPEIIEKLSISHRGLKSSLWQGGISKEIYPSKWKEVLKRSIRERDKHICQLCGIQQDELKGRMKRLSVHHIDYDKKNLDPKNLISLCIKCHTKTNQNRKYWKEFFYGIITK